MKKRTFLKVSALAGAGILLNPLASCTPSNESKEQATSNTSSGAFTLPELSYAYDALAPHIDARTMEIHHGKHHAGYVRKLNKALESSSYSGELNDILANVKPGDVGVRNNGGGHFNHTLFWASMTPGGQNMSTNFESRIAQQFGSTEAFNAEFAAAAASLFGSGWAWLIQNADGGLEICQTENQENPLMRNVVDQQGTPLLGIDVWEHAYYLNYQNKRKDYIQAFMQLIDWKAVEDRLA